MGAKRPTSDTGEIEVSRLGSDILLCVARGHVQRAHVLAAQARIEQIEAEDVDRVHALFDGSAIESFEPGLPMLWIQWSRMRPPRRGRVAVIGRTGPMIAIASTFRYLLPRLRVGLFRTRADAIAFLRGDDALGRATEA